jgi:hypothetical protein
MRHTELSFPLSSSGGGLLKDLPHDSNRSLGPFFLVSGSEISDSVAGISNTNRPFTIELHIRLRQDLAVTSIQWDLIREKRPLARVKNVTCRLWGLRRSMSYPHYFDRVLRHCTSKQGCLPYRRRSFLGCCRLGCAELGGCVRT